MSKQQRGFASMDPEKQRSIASKGGKSAHEKGRAHEWTVEEARAAGRKGGCASHRQPRPKGEADQSSEGEVQGDGGATVVQFGVAAE